MTNELFMECWRAPLPKFPSHSDQTATASPAMVRCVLLAIAERDGEFAPARMVGFRAGCSRHVAAWVIACLTDIGLVVDLGPDWDARPGMRCGGYKNNVRRLSINRGTLAKLLATPKAEIENTRWKRKRKAVLA